MFGIIKPRIDAHTLGISNVTNGLSICEYSYCIIESTDADEIVAWISDNKVIDVGFSYRLNPADAVAIFGEIYSAIRELVGNVYFAGLPESCERISKQYGDAVVTFSGGEELSWTLQLLGVPEEKIPASLLYSDPYDCEREKFATDIVLDKTYATTLPHMNTGGSYAERVSYCKEQGTLPIIRAHCGPYSDDRDEALALFYSWVADLRNAGYLDVLSVGSSQLTQEYFGEDWIGKANGGGVPINSTQEYENIRDIAKPMLVRTYAGVTEVDKLAQIHEESLDIAWHALSFWWFCETDGRGKNTLLQNLTQHFEAIKYIASTTKPLEANVMHHFAFRGADDISCIVAGYLTARASKMLGVRRLIVQCMLNNPRQTSGLQDIAKARALLRLVRSMEDGEFAISLQTRAGLDYLSKDSDKAKVQLAAATLLMDDIEPNNPNSPEIVHVVSYSEANELASPEMINESIQITFCALKKYRALKLIGKGFERKYEVEIQDRANALFDEAHEAIMFLERNISDLYTPEGFCRIFEMGCFQMPYLFDGSGKYHKVKEYDTKMFNGGVFCVDDNGEIVNTIERYKRLFEQEA